MIVHVGRRRPGRGRPPPAAPPRVARGSTTRTSRRPRRGRWRAPRDPGPTAEEQFLALGDGAALWLTEAAAAGCRRIRAKMAEAVDLAALHDPAAVDRALGQAATAGRFGRRRPGRDPGPSGRRLRPTAARPAGPARTTAWPRAPPAGPASVTATWPDRFRRDRFRMRPR